MGLSRPPRKYHDQFHSWNQIAVPIVNNQTINESSMTPGMFNELPAELLAAIVQDLPLDALRHLSAANSRLRQFLIPALFSTIRISDRPADEDAVTKVSAKYGRHVRGVHLIVDLEALALPLRAEEEEESMEGDGYRASFGMPGWSRKFLTGQTLPTVSSVTIQFALAAGRSNPVRHLDAAIEGSDTWRLRLDDMW
ncbi:hypothetical protein PG985_008026 [Apiospora marii]|uniref:F-box domain-containing protein n=1 Tax=Apiospora marii TaxID=335849 RepID=A0ABR1R9P9_9PEZI